jgi:hypothetical protein
MEKVSLSEAVKALASGMDLDLNAEISHIVADITNDKSLSALYTPLHVSLEINRMMYEFLREVEHDPACFAAVEKMSEIVDNALDRGDMDSLKKISDTLPDILLQRLRQYTIEREQKEKEILLKISAENS